MKFILLLFFIFPCILSAQIITSINSDIKKARELSQTNPKKSLELSENTYRLSKDINYTKGVLESGNILMAKYYDLGNYKKVIELGKATEGLSIEEENNEILANTYRLRASSYTELGFNDESYKEFSKALKITDKIKSKNSKYYLKSLIYIGLASHSAHINLPVDSVVYYQKKSLETIIKVDSNKDFVNKKNHTLALTYINLGKTSNAKQNIKEAESFFSKALIICQKDDLNKNLEIIVFNEFAWLYYDQKKYNESKKYAKQAENLEKHISIPYIRRDIYEVIFKSCVELGEKESSRKYMNLYTKLNDSLVNAEKKTINTPVNQIIEKQQKVHINNVHSIFIFIFIISLFLIGIFFYFWKQNQNKLHAKYKEIIKNIKKTDNLNKEVIDNTKQNIVSIDKTINITDETIKTILIKLNKFEKSQKYLKKDLSLTSLANDLNTNTRSLSEIIKRYKEKSYNSYINSLRINYIINILCDNPIYREYKISYLADVSGFSSREVFAVVFKKEAGVSPSYFINNLKKDQLLTSSSAN
ncbi:helix-turn-helix domain-containing protein [Chryseobacterium sp. G0201]|uniref:helix-turn-helix domain-containing protein n=1 Tax=Chryseobacterium sp. G0201 TaxID=2487065 RepID=UPI000F4FA016|nr:helix-turn-helix domain-containing protein [Chryseobacterium sp. G0201]AZA53968.1 helix-turn-helix domain-containing protein [Chryseobacterium sp. G0201]